MPNAAAVAESPAIAELDAIPSLHPDLLVLPESASGASDAPVDLLCRKGTAVATRSRSYDHKEAFEPAQGAVAPPSDADELGSWLKYDGSQAVPARKTNAVSDEDQPTTWFKYETKPVGSLLDARETPHQKPLIQFSSIEREAGPSAEIAADPAASKATTVTEVSCIGAPQEAESASAEAEISAADTFDSEPLMPPIQESAAPENAFAEPETPALITEIVEPLPSSSSLTDSASAQQENEAPFETAADHPAVETREHLPHDEPPLAASPATPGNPFSTGEPAAAEPIPAMPPLGPLEPSEPAWAPAPSGEEVASAPESAQEAHDQARAESATVPPQAVAPENNIGSSAKKAMLARLAEMLEQALVAKRAASAPDDAQNPPSVDALESPPVAADLSMPEAGGISDAELLLPRSPDAAAHVSSAAPTEVSTAVAETLSFSLADPQTTPEALEREVVDPPLPNPEEGTAEIVAPKVPAFPPVTLLSEKEAWSEAAVAVSNIEINGASVPSEELRVEPEASERALDPLVDERLAASLPDAIDEPATPAIEPDDKLTIPAVETQAPERKPMLGLLGGMLEHLLPRKPSAKVPEEPPQVTEPDELGNAPPSIGVTPVVDAGDVIALSGDIPTPIGADPTLVAPELVGSATPELPAAEATDLADASPISEPVFAAPTIDALSEPVSPAETEAADSTDIQALTDDEGGTSEPAPMLADAPQDFQAPESTATSELDISVAAPAIACEGGDFGTSMAPEPPTGLSSIGATVADDDTMPMAPAEEPRPEPLTPNVPPDPIIEIAAGDGELRTDAPADTMLPVSPQYLADHSVPDAAAPLADAAIEAAAVSDVTPVTDPPEEEQASAPPQPTESAPPMSRAEEEKAARRVLADGLADMIHDVLSTRQFATKAMKPGRYTHAQMLLEAEPVDLESGLAPEALPHPVAIRSRLGRAERLLALASVGMMIAVGYFAFSLWGDGHTVAAPSPVIAAPAPATDARGERTRDMARDLGSTAAVIDISGAASAAPQSGTSSHVPPPQPRAAQAAR